MASPFRFFWKYQKPMMVVVTGIAIICFVLTDTLQMTGDSHAGNKSFLPFLLGLIGMIIAWVGGMRRPDESKNYWWQGGIIGAALGVVLMIATATPDEGIATSLGNLNQRKIQELKTQRNLANTYVQFAFFKREKPQNRELQSLTFGDNSTRDVVISFLLGAEADKLGIQVSNESVNEYLNGVSEKNVSGREFQKFCNDHKTDQSRLFKAIRYELRARIALSAIQPRLSYSPDQYWQDFEKFHIRHSIETVAVPTDAFVKLVEAPAEGDLIKFFDQYKSSYPSGEFAGFRIPPRKRVAYITTSFEAVEKEVGTVSEADLKGLYETRKELFYKQIDLLPDQGESGSKPQDKDSKPATESKPAAPEPKVDEPKSDAPKADPSTSDKKPEAEKAKPADPVKPAETPEKKDEKKPEDKPAGSDCDDQAEATQPAKSDAKATDAPPIAEDKAADKKDPAAAKAPVDRKDKLPESKSEPESAVKDTPKYKTFEEVRDDLRDVLLRDRTQALIKKKFAAAHAAILSEQQAVRDEFAQKVDDAAAKGTAPVDKAEVPQKILAHAKTYAKQHGLTYTETELVTYQELIESKEHQLGTARDPFDPDNVRTEPQSAPDRIFGGGSALFIPEIAESADTKSRFVFWSIEEVDETVPKFEDAGIRERVEAAYRIDKARPMAQKRAAELVKLATEGIAAKKSFAESLGEAVTATGEKDSIELSVISTPPFAWLVQANQGLQANFFSQREFGFGTIPGVDKVHNDFMQSVAGMAVGELKLIANADKSAYHVVHLKSRSPSEPDDLGYKAIRQQYLSDSQFGFFMSPVSEISRQKLTMVYGSWLGKFMEKYSVDVKALDQN